jgi:hypothetical protein
MVDTRSLSVPDLAALGWLPIIRDADDAPLGYAQPVLETRDGQQAAVQYALGTPEERAAETLRQWRLTATCTASQGEIVLAEENLRAGWLALIATLPEVLQIKYQREPLWNRSDDMMELGMSHLRPDLDEDARALYVDALFRRAALK